MLIYSDERQSTWDIGDTKLHPHISTVSEKSVFLKKTWSCVSTRILSRIFTSDPNPTALSDVYRLFTTIVYLEIQVACYDAIFDCITI